MMDLIVNLHLLKLLGHYKFLAVCSWATAVICIALAILIYRANSKSKVCRLNCAFNLGIAFWAGGHGFMYFITNETLSYFNNQLLTTGAILIPVFLTHLVVTETKVRQAQVVIRLTYLGAGILFILTWMPGRFFVESSIPTLDFPAYTKRSTFYFLLPIYMFGNLFLSLFFLIKAFVQEKSKARQLQLKLLCMAIALGFLGGTPAYFLMFDIPIKPYTVGFVAVYPLIITYAIAKHRFLNIEQLIKKTALFSIFFTASITLLALALFFFQNILELVMESNLSESSVALWGSNATGIFHPYVTTGYLTAFVTITIGSFVFLKNKHSKIHQSFFLLAIAIAQWSFFTALMGMQTNHDQALLWGRVCHVGVMFIPVFFFYFTGAIVGRPRPKTLKAGYIIATLMSVGILSTPFFIPYERTDAGPNFMVAPGIFYSLIILFFGLYVGMSLKILFSEAQKAKGLRRKHIQYFFWSSIAGYGLGGINFLPVYGITIPPYPYTAACGAVYYGILAYAIMRHRLFDIEVLVKKGLVFTLLFTLVYSLVTGLIYFLGYFISGEHKALLSITSILMAMIIYEPLRNLLTRLTHSFLFQQKQDYTALIDELTQKASESADLQSISHEITTFFHQKLGVEWCALYTFTPEDHLFQKISVAGGGEKLAAEVSFTGLEALFKETPEPYLINPFDTDSRISVEVRTFARDHKVEVIVPFFVDRKLAAVMLLSKKKSDREFSHQDEIVMKTVMQRTSMLLLSGRLLKEVMTSNLELGQRIKMTALTKLAKGVHHEVRNPLHALSLYASATKNLFRNQSPQSPLDDPTLLILRERMEVMLEQIQATKTILERFTQFAMPNEDEKLDVIDLKEALDKFLALMQEGHRLDHVAIQMEGEAHLNAYATQGALQEILFNLFNNAIEAMKGKGHLQFQLRKHGEFAELFIRDTGSGISAETFPHIFEEYFTTKQNTEAIGIGLSITKHRVESLGGTVDIKNHEHGGAEVRIQLKAA